MSALSDLPLFRPSERFGQQAQKRAATQLEAVWLLTWDRDWWTLAQLVARLKSDFDIRATEAAVSARLRDLRKAQHGSCAVDRKEDHFIPGLWRYRVGPPGSEPHSEIQCCPLCKRKLPR